MASPAIAAWIAHLLFWGLLVYGLIVGDLGLKRFAIFVLLWLAALVVLPFASYEPARSMFSSFVAILDIGLVFAIFKGDVTLT
jgi:hypothetical protein